MRKVIFKCCSQKHKVLQFVGQLNSSYKNFKSLYSLIKLTARNLFYRCVLTNIQKYKQKMYIEQTYL